MDVDGQPSNTSQLHPPSPKLALQPANAIAGPSSHPEQPSPPVFLPPPPAQPPFHPYFDSTQDLLSRFQLLSAYDRYVRPYAAPVGPAGVAQPQAPPSASDKGKGKEREVLPRDIASPTAAQTPGAGNDGEDEDGQGKGEKKWKNNYKHLIKSIPGKHSTKKDDYLMTMMQVPPKQRIQIQPFDLRTQRDAFSVSLDGLKGWNINGLVGESPQAKEDRKRRKELRKLAKAQGQAGVQLGLGTSSIFPTAIAAPAAVPSANTPGRTATPRPGLVSSQLHYSQPAQRGHTPAGVGTPRPTTSAASTNPMPPQMVASAQHTPIPTPAPTPGTAAGAPVEALRGIKREREGSIGQVNGTGQGQAPTPGVTTGTNGWTKPPGVMNAKAGSAGVRPRPIKKQRVDVQGQAREIPMQQPTPHA